MLEKQGESLQPFLWPPPVEDFKRWEWVVRLSGQVASLDCKGKTRRSALQKKLMFVRGGSESQQEEDNVQHSTNVGAASA